MAITRARRTPPAAPRAKRRGTTPERFIEGADAPAEALPETPPTAATANREAQALAVVKEYLPWAAGAGILPLPGIDVALIISVQLRMLAKLAEVYGVPFSEQAAKSIVATLMATLVQNTVMGSLVYALRFTPLLGLAVLPAVAAAGTYALGKVFITHFEAGGTFLEFDPNEVRNHFRAEFEKARSGGSKHTPT